MECRQFEVTLISAVNLPNVRELGQMKVYAKVLIKGYSNSEWITSVDRERETNPYWNCRIKYTLPEKAVEKDGVLLVIKLYCERSLLPDKYENLEYYVNRNDVDGKFGKLKLSYDFGKTTVTISEKEPSFGEAVVEGAMNGVLHAAIAVDIGRVRTNVINLSTTE
ncbi:protein SRC2 homolog [Coffea arabica]|uniref:Protein SRC2 homolog n=1 Tax=Coffea arabica TaxID=13443 RepID=A0ABM4VUN8_COFAR